MFEISHPRDAPPGTSLSYCNACLAGTRLAGLPFLSSTERAAIAACAAARRDVRSGTELTNESETPGAIYFLESGWAGKYIETDDGRRQISALLLPGDVCNLDSVLFGRLDSGVSMLTAGTVLAVPRERIADLLASHSGSAFAWLGAVENAILARRVFCLGRLSAEERMAHFLCELAVRLGLANNDAEPSFNLPLTQEQLGDVLGLTAVHVNRMLLQLRTRGLLASTWRLVEISDVPGLRKIGQFDPGYLHSPSSRASSVSAMEMATGDLQ